MSEMPLLNVITLSRRFGGLMAVRDVSLQVRRGEIVGLIGPNGAGKTTLFRCVVGVLKPSAGRVLLDGRRIDGLSPHAVVARGVCHTHQVPAPFLDLSVRDNVRVGAEFGRRSRTADAVTARVLAETGLESLTDTPARNLGIGNLKLLEVARALATGPSLLCVDEVGSGLSPVELERILNLLRAVRESGVTILYIEHNMHAIASVCDRVAVLEFGQKIAEGRPEEISHDPEVIRAYLGTPAAVGPALS